MKKLTVILLLAALLPATSLAGGYYIEGNELLAWCEADNDACPGYIMGIDDSHTAYLQVDSMEPKFCIPEGVRANQLVKIAVKFLNDHPEDLHYPASIQVITALFEAFPASVKDDGTKYCPDEERIK